MALPLISEGLEGMVVQDVVRLCCANLMLAPPIPATPEFQAGRDHVSSRAPAVSRCGAGGTPESSGFHTNLLLLTAEHSTVRLPFLCLP